MVWAGPQSTPSVWWLQEHLYKIIQMRCVLLFLWRMVRRPHHLAHRRKVEDDGSGRKEPPGLCLGLSAFPTPWPTGRVGVGFLSLLGKLAQTCLLLSPGRCGRLALQLPRRRQQITKSPEWPFPDLSVSIHPRAVFVHVAYCRFGGEASRFVCFDCHSRHLGMYLRTHCQRHRRSSFGILVNCGLVLVRQLANVILLLPV